MTKQQIDDAKQAIVETLGEQHWATKSRIGKGIAANAAIKQMAEAGLEVSGLRLFAILKGMISAKTVKSVAENPRRHWYALAAEESQPPFKKTAP
ncbi:MAG: hypothetical protein V2A73_22415 [Pseudomonadota bacterium]